MVAIAAGCSESTTPQATVAHTAVMAPAASTPAAPMPPPLVIPTPQGTFRRCEVAQLEGELIRIGAAAGNIEGIVELRNR